VDFRLELVLIPVSDVDRAKTFYTKKHLAAGVWTPGPHPERTDYNSFADFSDPDGNTWVLQERGHI